MGRQPVGQNVPHHIHPGSAECGQLGRKASPKANSLMSGDNSNILDSKRYAKEKSKENMIS
jgi:hypothetical protein